MTSDSHAAAFELIDVVKRYGSRTILDGLSLGIRPGEFVALLGPNGVGKTTLVEMLEGYRGPDSGEVRVLGEDPRRGGPGLRARMGVMLQSGGLDPRATPDDILKLYAALHDRPLAPADLIGRVGLSGVARTSIRRLSGGERQRLALAVALVGDPEVLILDEPTAGMDPEARRGTRAVIADRHSEGSTILMTTHDLGDVERLADRVVILSDRRVVADASPANLLVGSARRVSIRLADPPTPGVVAGFNDALVGRLRGAPVRLALGDGPAAIHCEGAPLTPELVAAIASVAATLGLQILELRAGAATLEERYLELTGDRDVESVA